MHQRREGAAATEEAGDAGRWHRGVPVAGGTLCVVAPRWSRWPEAVRVAGGGRGQVGEEEVLSCCRQGKGTREHQIWIPCTLGLCS